MGLSLRKRWGGETLSFIFYRESQEVRIYITPVILNEQRKEKSSIVLKTVLLDSKLVSHFSYSNMKLFHIIFSVLILIFSFSMPEIFSQDEPKKSCNEIYELKNESFKNKVFLESGKFLLDIVSNPKPNCNLKLVFKKGIASLIYLTRLLFLVNNRMED